MVTGFQKTIDGDVQGLRAILSQDYPRGSSIPKRAARASRALKITLPAKMERLCPDRPGLPPVSRRHKSTARIVASGFGHGVVALSK